MTGFLAELDWARRGAELSAKGGVTGVGMSLWGVSLYPLLLENPVLMDRLGNPLIGLLGPPVVKPELAMVACAGSYCGPCCFASAQMPGSHAAECSPLWSLRPQSASHPPL